MATFYANPYRGTMRAAETTDSQLRHAESEAKYWLDRADELRHQKASEPIDATFDEVKAPQIEDQRP